MGKVMVDGREAPMVQSVEEMTGRFHRELMTLAPQWKQELADDPAQLEAIEREVQKAFSRGADLLVAGLIAVVMQQEDFDAASEQTRQDFAAPLAAGRKRTIRVRLLGGLIIWVASLYCSPQKASRWQKEKRSGLHIELAQFGFGKGVSPGLESRVARQAALCPSMEFAQQELQRNGVQIDTKTVCRITYQCGEGLLRLRTQWLTQWKAGQMPAGCELRGKRVSVQIDGGRMRIRSEMQLAPKKAERIDADGLPIEDAPGRSKKRPAKTFAADWREPKLLTIFVHDEQGRMVKKCKATIDGTLEGPDAIAELVAMHLHRLGAAEALSVSFVADGAPWIWDRIERIVKLAKLENVALHEVLDCCHAGHHISLALAELGLNAAERLPLYREHRTLLRNGQWRRVVEELSELADMFEAGAKMQTEIAYLRKHGEAGRLSYPHFRGLGLPIGSGAIESSIRRVINLRLKSNAMFWKEPNAEAMLQVRSQVITDQWDDRLKAMRNLNRRQRLSDWRWSPQPMSGKVEAENQTAS
jgi:hypothetical protein